MQQQQQPLQAQQQQQQLPVVNLGGQQCLGYAVPQPQYLVSVTPSVVPTYRARLSIALGAILISVGILSIVFNIVDLSFLKEIEYTLGVAGHGFWTGLMSALAGGFGVAAGRTKGRCQIVTFNVLCIITASFTAAEFALGISGAVTVNDSDACYSIYNYYSYYMQYYYDSDYMKTVKQECKGSTAMEALLAVTAVVQAVASIWGSVICCRAACCCDCCLDRSSRNLQPERAYVVQYSGMPVTVLTTNNQGQMFQMVSPQFYPYQVPTATTAAPDTTGQQWIGPPQYNQVVTAPYLTNQPPAYPGVVQPSAPATTGNTEHVPLNDGKQENDVSII